MKIIHTALLNVLVALLLFPPGALFAAERGGELAVQNTAIEKMLMQELFVDRGRYYLLPETRCQYAYVDSPAVTIFQGRVRIKVRLSGKLAAEVGDQCVGSRSDVVRLMVSGKPTFAGEEIGLTDVRVDEVSNDAYRLLLQQFLESAVPRAVAINVRAGLQRMLADRQTKYEVVVSQLSVTRLTAESNVLHATLTFSLMAR